MGRFKKALLIFTILNLSLYFYIWKFNSFVPFNEFLYKYSSHHYFQDDRISGGRFNFLRAQGVWDSQWYLKIADRGYPFHPANASLDDKTVMEGLTYAFSPLYPFVLAALNLVIGYPELTAFILSLLLMGANFYSLYYVTSGLYKEQIAYKTVFLLFLFPFSLFYRSYFTEGLFLLLLIWYCYFLIKRKWGALSLFQGLLTVTRPTGLFFLPLTLILMAGSLINKKINPAKALIYLPLMFGFFALWLIFNYQMTGNIFYWKDVQTQWVSAKSFFDIMKHNYILLKSFFSLPFHAIHYSRVDILTFFGFGWVLWFSLSFLKKELWWVSFLMWIIPLVIRDTTSYSRYQIVSFPLFIYLSSILNRKHFALISSFLFALLLFLSLYFVNWYWFG